MKRFWLSIMAVLLITAAAVPAFAWEFSMNGEFEFRLRYYSRTGNADLWGDASVQENPALNMWDSYNGFFAVGPTLATAAGPNYIQNDVGGTDATTTALSRANFIGFAGPNIYQTGIKGAANAATTVVADDVNGAGVRITRGGFSRYGSDALYNDMKLTMHPSIKVNNAIRVHGVYTIGGFRNKYAQYGRDAQGDLSSGVAPFERYYSAFSSVAAYNTAAIGSWEQVRATIQWPLGVLSIGIKDFPFGLGANWAQNSRSDTFVNIIPYGPFRFIQGVWLAEGSIFNSFVSYNSVPDRDTKNDVFLGILADYNQGPLNMGVGYIYNRVHAPAWISQSLPATAFGGPGVLGIDVVWQRYDATMKYNNGRFFANAEYYWDTRDYMRLGTFPIYREGYNFFADAGVLAGPAKISLMYAQASGRPRHANPGFDNRTKDYLARNINYQVLRPYQHLIFETYGSGNNSFNADGTGEVSDAVILAGRLDYAAAANLNLFGTFLYAKRLERNGDYAGSYNTAFTNAGASPIATSTTAGNAQLWKAAATGQAPAGLNPYVDDNFLGWEAQGGVDWKLLEGLTMNVAYAYWQPGQWFNQAYRAVSSAPIGLQGYDMWQTQRSAIHGLRGSFTVDF